MFAVYVEEPKPESPLDALVVGERPAPEVPEGWVRVKVTAASLNMHDVWLLRGVGLPREGYPMILGCDGSGTLDDGTEVVIYPIINDPSWRGNDLLDPNKTLLTSRYQGSFADYVVVPSRNAIPRPAGLSAVNGSVLGVAWLTAYRMLAVQSGLRPGQTMLVQGASGGVSTALIQLGQAAGMQVWVTGRSEEKRALAERLGAHRTFASNEDLPRKVDAVFDTVGEATWRHSMSSVKPSGVIVVAGMTSGAEPSADLMRLFLGQMKIVGSVMGTLDELRDLMEFVAITGISPHIGLQLPLTEAAEGFRAMEEGRTSGKIVFTHGD